MCLRIISARDRVSGTLTGLMHEACDYSLPTPTPPSAPPLAVPRPRKRVLPKPPPRRLPPPPPKLR